MRDVVLVRLLGRDQALLAKRRHDRLASVVGLHARVRLARRVGHPAVLADHRDLLEPVLAADLEVVGVVARA